MASATWRWGERSDDWATVALLGSGRQLNVARPASGECVAFGRSLVDPFIQPVHPLHCKNDLPHQRGAFLLFLLHRYLVLAFRCICAALWLRGGSTAASCITSELDRILYSC
jgi:hypothetical protein